MRRRLAALFLLASACGRDEAASPVGEEDVAAALSTLALQPGQWRTTTRIVGVDGPMPEIVAEAMVGRTSGQTSCITAEQAARPSASFFAAQQGSDCTYADFTVEDGRLNASMTCRGGDLPGPMRANMAGRYAPDSYDVGVVMASDAAAGAAVTIQTRSTGRRLGDCPG